MVYWVPPLRSEVISLGSGTNFPNILIEPKNLCKKLIDSLYTRTDKSHLERGEFKVVGDGIIIHPSNKDIYYKIEFWGDQIDNIEIKFNDLKIEKRGGVYSGAGF